MNEKMKCPFCGSYDTVCMDGVGMTDTVGKNIVTEICPEMFLCKSCGETFRADIFGEWEAER